MPEQKKADLERARELVRLLEGQMSDRMPAPPNTEMGAVFEQHLIEGQRRRDGRDIHMFPPHLREWFDTISPDDLKNLKVVVGMRPDTLEWIHDKNPRELKQLDGAVEFITSSRTAGKWLLWIGGLSVTFVGGVTALAKNGYDLFALFRGGR